MQDIEANWSPVEKKAAQEAFEKAYEREISALLEQVRVRAGEIAELEDLWGLHDFLSAKRHEIDGKYDYSYLVLLFVFANLIKDGWLHIDELKNLDKDKLAKIAALKRLWNFKLLLQCEVERWAFAIDRLYPNLSTVPLNGFFDDRSYCRH